MIVETRVVSKNWYCCIHDSSNIATINLSIHSTNLLFLLHLPPLGASIHNMFPWPGEDADVVDQKTVVTFKRAHVCIIHNNILLLSSFDVKKIQLLNFGSLLLKNAFMIAPFFMITPWQRGVGSIANTTSVGHPYGAIFYVKQYWNFKSLISTLKNLPKKDRHRPSFWERIRVSEKFWIWFIHPNRHNFLFSEIWLHSVTKNTPTR